MKQAFKAVFLSAALLLPLSGQTWPTLEVTPNTWTDTWLVTVSSDGKEFRLDPRNPNSTLTARVVAVPPGARGAVWCQGAGWSFQITRDGTGEDLARTLKLYRYTPTEGWSVEATYPVSKGTTVPIYLSPLGKPGDFLAIAPSSQFFKDKKAYSPVAVFRKSHKGELELDHLIKFPLKKDLWEMARSSSENLEDRENPSWRREYGVGNEALLTPYMLPGYLALVWRRPGFIWLLSLETGDVKRMVKLFPGIGEEDLKKYDEMEVSVLGVQPTSDGRLLVATREEYVVMNSLKHFDYVMTLDKLKKGEVKEIHRREEIALLAYPYIQWWHVSPEEGTVSSALRPLNIPARFTSLQQFNAFNFRFLTNGNLDVHYSGDTVFRLEKK